MVLLSAKLGFVIANFRLPMNTWHGQRNHSSNEMLVCPLSHRHHGNGHTFIKFVLKEPADFCNDPETTKVT